MSKIKKLLSVLIISVMFLAAVGCGNNSAQTGSQSSQEAESSQAQSSDVTSSDNNTGNGDSSTPSSTDIVSTVPSVISESPASGAVLTSQTQQEALNNVKKSLGTSAPLLLPKNVPIDSGKFLTAVTSSGKSKYSVKLFQTSKPADINSKAASKGMLIAALTGTQMKDTGSAKESIADDGYMQVKASSCGDDCIDLGNNIKAVPDCGCGHQAIVWSEGRWCIRIDSPTDKTMASKKYPDSKPLAISVAAYLNKNMLPAPQKIGIIKMSTWKSDSSSCATVEWQNGKTVYQIDSSSPMAALEIAVAMKAV